MTNFTKNIIGTVFLFLIGSPAFAEEPVFKAAPIPFSGSKAESDVTTTVPSAPDSSNDINTILIAKYMQPNRFILHARGEHIEYSHKFEVLKSLKSKRSEVSGYIQLTGRSARTQSFNKGKVYLLLLHDPFVITGGSLQSASVNFETQVFEINSTTVQELQ